MKGKGLILLIENAQNANTAVKTRKNPSKQKKFSLIANEQVFILIYKEF